MAAGDSVLRNYGLFQGHEPSADGRRGAAQHNVEFSLSTIKALIVTHVHIDHVGRIPHLLAAGYNGPICSAPSAKLLPIVLEDAFKLGFSRDSKEIARYHKLAEQRLHPLPYNQWFVLLKTSQLCPRIRLQRERFSRLRLCQDRSNLIPPLASTNTSLFPATSVASHAPLLIPLTRACDGRDSGRHERCMEEAQPKQVLIALLRMQHKRLNGRPRCLGKQALRPSVALIFSNFV